MRIRKIIGDQSSAEFDQLRRTSNNLLRMLEGAEASLAAGADAEAVLQAWADAIRDGVDANNDSETNVVATNVPIVGLKPINGGGLPRHPSQNKATEPGDSFDV